MHDKKALKGSTKNQIREGNHCLPLEALNKKRSLKKKMITTGNPHKQNGWKSLMGEEEGDVIKSPFGPREPKHAKERRERKPVFFQVSS